MAAWHRCGPESAAWLIAANGVSAALITCRKWLRVIIIGCRVKAEMAAIIGFMPTRRKLAWHLFEHRRGGEMSAQPRLKRENIGGSAGAWRENEMAVKCAAGVKCGVMLSSVVWWRQADVSMEIPETGSAYLSIIS